MGDEKGCMQIMVHLHKKGTQTPLPFPLPAGWNIDVMVVVGTIISNHKREAMCQIMANKTSEAAWALILPLLTRVREINFSLA